MPMIVIPAEEDEKLEQIVPPYLRGQNRASQRVRWAIADALERRGITPPANGKEPSPDSDTA